MAWHSGADFLFSNHTRNDFTTSIAALWEGIADKVLPVNYRWPTIVGELLLANYCWQTIANDRHVML
jgi:hypothetical protein